MSIGEAGEPRVTLPLFHSFVRSCISLCFLWANQEQGAGPPKKRTGSQHRRNMESYGDHTSHPGGMSGTAGNSGPQGRTSRSQDNYIPDSEQLEPVPGTGNLWAPARGTVSLLLCHHWLGFFPTAAQAGAMEGLRHRTGLRGPGGFSEGGVEEKDIPELVHVN